MTFDGISAVQARIAQIQDLVTATVAAANPAGATAGTSTSSSSSSSSSQFASLLQEAMAAGSLGSDPLADPSTAGSSTSDPLAALTGTGTSSSGTSGLLTELTQLMQQGQASTATPSIGATGSSLAQQFLNVALGQQGKPYVYGTTNVNDPNPKSFDCEGLVKWAAAHVGVQMPSGATAQYVYVRDHGGAMTVQQALHTPGALLFHFSHEPRNAGDVPADGHVAISVGDGVHTMEARGRAYGVNEFANADGRSFNYAGMIPGM